MYVQIWVALLYSSTIIQLHFNQKINFKKLIIKKKSTPRHQEAVLVRQLFGGKRGRKERGRILWKLHDEKEKAKRWEFRKLQEKKHANNWGTHKSSPAPALTEAIQQSSHTVDTVRTPADTPETRGQSSHHQPWDRQTSHTPWYDALRRRPDHFRVFRAKMHDLNLIMVQLRTNTNRGTLNIPKNDWHS